MLLTFGKHKHEIKIMAIAIASTTIIVAGIIGAAAILMKKRNAAAAALQGAQPSPSAARIVPHPAAGAPRDQQEYII